MNAGSAFRQQRLKAWQPILTPRTVLPAFFVLGICFIPIGIVLFFASNGVRARASRRCVSAWRHGVSQSVPPAHGRGMQVNEISLDYTFCPNNTNQPSNILAWHFDPVTLNCNITFNIATTWTGPVYMYYGLTKYVGRVSAKLGHRLLASPRLPLTAARWARPHPPTPPPPAVHSFYQNHRRYVKSYVANQLKGQVVAVADLSDCSPLDTTVSASGITLPIYPCGLIANSLFNGLLPSSWS